MQQRPNISRKAFWDTRFEDLDFQKQKNAIIVKVFEYGRWDDMLAIARYYGSDAVKEALLSSYHLSDATLAFSSAIFSLPKEQFKCYAQKQSQKTHWPF
jgi:hypothetical protein